MGIFGKLAFWKKKELPNLPEDNPPLQGPTEFPQYDEKPPFPQENFSQSRHYTPPPPQFDEPQPVQQNSPNSEFQVISSKLDVLNAKIEVLSERLNNIEKNLNDAKVRW